MAYFKGEMEVRTISTAFQKSCEFILYSAFPLKSMIEYQYHFSKETYSMNELKPVLMSFRISLLSHSAIWRLDIANSQLITVEETVISTESYHLTPNH